MGLQGTNKRLKCSVPDWSYPGSSPSRLPRYMNEILFTGHRVGFSAIPWLIRRFHYELRRRFDYRRSASEYEQDNMAVCEAVSDALCSVHMDQAQLVEPFLALLYTRRGDCAMQGRSAEGTRSLPCILCLYGSEIPPKRVKHPIIYSNRLIEEGLTTEDDLKTIEGKVVRPDYCDRWSFKLLSLLFSGNWNSMECAVYSKKVPVVAGRALREILKKVLAFRTEAAIHEGITPWVVFELCHSYGLNASKFIQNMYDASVRLATSENDRAVMEKVDRILGGIASIYDYRKLRSSDPQSIVVGSETGGIVGCLYLYNGMDDNTFADRYIFHRWLMEGAYTRLNAQDDLCAIQYWCAVYAIAVKKKGQRLSFCKGPWTLTGVLQEKSRGFYHFKLEDELPADEIPDESVNCAEGLSSERMTFICDARDS